MRWRTAVGLVGTLAGVACAAAPEPPPKRPPPPVAVAKPRPPAPVEWTHWDALDFEVHANVARPDLPLATEQIARAPGADSRWQAATEELRERLRRTAFATAPIAEARARHGARYVELRELGAPFFVSFDALFHLAHLAMDRALADYEDGLYAPALQAMLARLEGRFASEHVAAGADLAPAYALARGVVAVALALRGTPPSLPADVAQVVAAELRRVRDAHGPAESPLLGAPLDYAAFAPRGDLGGPRVNGARAGAFAAALWLAAAPLALAHAGEIDGGMANVHRTRTHVRAALLFARALDADADPAAAKLWGALARAAKFIVGAPDDPGPPDIAEVAARAKIDVRDLRAIGNVANVDRVRHALVDRHLPRVYDGAGGLRARASAGDASPLALRASMGVRLLGARVTPDAEVLQGLVFPAVGAVVAGAAAPETARDGVRALPRSLDVGAWLGSAEARLALHETGDDAYAGFDAALDALYRRRPGENEAARHASVYMSALDVFATYLAPSAADVAQPMAQSAAWRRRKLEVALGAWTLLRHDLVPFARAPSAPSASILVNRISGSNVTGFVEPHPEALAKLVALVRQLVRGLDAMGALGPDAPSRPLLAEIDGLLHAAFRIALREANDEPLTGEEGAELAAMPARIAELEARLGAGVADVPRVVDVHTDVAGARVLEEGTGYLDELAVVVREPVSGRMVLAFGTSTPHFELAQPASQRMTDAAWRARLDAGSAPRRHAFVAAYRVP